MVIVSLQEVGKGRIFCGLGVVCLVDSKLPLNHGQSQRTNWYQDAGPWLAWDRASLFATSQASRDCLCRPSPLSKEHSITDTSPWLGVWGLWSSSSNGPGWSPTQPPLYWSLLCAGSDICNHIYLQKLFLSQVPSLYQGRHQCWVVQSLFTVETLL